MTMPNNKKQIFSFTTKEEVEALDFLAVNTKLSKMQLKKLFAAGAVWIVDKNNEKRIRKVKSIVPAGIKLRVYFDPNIKPYDMSGVRCLHDTHNWGIWYKPAGLLSQGTKYGDEYSILREVEKRLNKAPFLVHRLDRETSGLMIIAYNKKACAHFSDELKHRKIKKYYQAVLLGNLETNEGIIKTQIEGAEAITEYKVLKRNDTNTLVECLLVTGKKHQLRIHFSELGHPIMGDPRYGKNNSHSDGLQLVANKITLNAPGRFNEMTFELKNPDELLKL